MNESLVERRQDRLNILQNFRGVAAILVLLYHASGLFLVYYKKEYAYGIFKQGYIGVDLFFVLSGFIIFYIHSKDIGKSETTKSFLMKRFLRVYPVCWAVLLPLIPVYFFNPSFGNNEFTSIGSIVKSLLLYPLENSLLVVIWTLSQEIIFYLMFCTLLLFKPKFACIVLASWVLGTFCFSFGFVKTDHHALEAFFSPINFEFLTGCLIAYLIKKKVAKTGMSSLIVGLLTVAFFWIAENIELFKISRIIAYGIPFALMIYGAVLMEMQGKIKSSKVFSFLGDASYSIYLTHYPFLSAINKVFSKFNLYTLIGYTTSLTIIILLTLGMGVLFYLSVERPIMAKSKKLFSRRRQVFNPKAFSEVS